MTMIFVITIALLSSAALGAMVWLYLFYAIHNGFHNEGEN